MADLGKGSYCGITTAGVKVCIEVTPEQVGTLSCDTRNLRFTVRRGVAWARVYPSCSGPPLVFALQAGDGTKASGTCFNSNWIALDCTQPPYNQDGSPGFYGGRCVAQGSAVSSGIACDDPSISVTVSLSPEPIYPYNSVPEQTVTATITG